MGEYIGVIELNSSIPCQKEVSGKSFKSKIAGHDVLITFPSIPDDYDARKVPNLEKGDLVVPGNIFKDQVNWGTVNEWPLGLFLAHNLLCYISGEESDINEIYAGFPHWRDKLQNLQLIDTGDYLLPEQAFPTFMQGGGFYDGLQVFEVVNEKNMQYIPNFRATKPIKVRLVTDDETFSAQKLEDLFVFAGEKKEIALAYELLITAYRAMERSDFRSAVILGGSALEQAILKRMRQEYPSKTKFKKAKNTPRHCMLKGRFSWLIEKGISIPVSDYKKTIIDVRNDVTHDGVLPSHSEAKLCLENCKILIEACNPDYLET